MDEEQMIRRLRLLPLLLLLVVPAYAQTPTAPTITRPTAAQTDVFWNPVIFWSAYTQTGGDINDIQLDFQIEITTKGGACAFGVGLNEYERKSSNLDCAASSPVDCYGSGMAHHVCDGSDGRTCDYPGVFKNALAGQSQLSEGTTYCVRMRVRGTAATTWSDYSATVEFTTVAYDGTTYYLDNSDVWCAAACSDASDCLTTANACKTLKGVLNKVTDDNGDIVIIKSGTTETVTDRDNVSSDGIDTSDPDPASFDRVWIKTDVEGTRATIQADYSDNSVAEFIRLNDIDQVIWQDIIFKGGTTCCTVNLDSWNIIRMQLSTQLTFLNVDFQPATHLILDEAGSETDFMWWGGAAYNRPVDTRGAYNQAPDATHEKINLGTAFAGFTLIGMDFDNNEEHIQYSNVAGNTWDDWLIESSRFRRGYGHPFRNIGLASRHTLRRVRAEEGQEGFHYGSNDNSDGAITLSVENSSFTKAFINCAGKPAGLMTYLAMVNNHFGADDTGTAGLKIDQATAGRACDSVTPVGGLDIIDASTRILLDYNNFWRETDAAQVVEWEDGTGYVRCHATNPETDDWFGVGAFLTNSLATTDGCDTGRDYGVDPEFATICPYGDGPACVEDLTPDPTSGLIDAGHPSYYYGSGDAPVDIGAIEAAAAAAGAGSTVNDGEGRWHWLWGIQ